MADPTVQHLFRKWRQGDAEAGQEMAQKFSDWYYAITTIRVADKSGRQPLERACQAFAQGIVSVTRPSTLVDWAHDLLERELQAIGRGMGSDVELGGDYPNALTQNRSPSDLIREVIGSLDESHARLLAMAYDPGTDLSVLQATGDDMGGLPFALLDARYALKRVLFSNAQVPFSVVPDVADMDRAPISLYEANRLASAQETTDLEKWLLSDIDLCKDVAEFAAFVHALRGGALSDVDTRAPAATAAPAPAAQPSEAKPAPDLKAEPPAEQAGSVPTSALDPTPDATTQQPPVEEAPSAEPVSSDLPAPEPEDPADAEPATVSATVLATGPSPKGGSMSTILWTALIVFVAFLTFFGVAVMLLRWG